MLPECQIIKPAAKGMARGIRDVLDISKNCNSFHGLSGNRYSKERPSKTNTSIVANACLSLCARAALIILTVLHSVTHRLSLCIWPADSKLQLQPGHAVLPHLAYRVSFR
jgi:hypothetical protein